MDPSQTQPGIELDPDLPSQVVVGEPFGGFVGGDNVTLQFNGSQPLRAFGADFFFAPNFANLPGDLYQLTVLDGTAAGTTVGNPADLPADLSDPRTFFLGIIVDPGSTFSEVSLSSVAMDANGNFPPAYEADNLTFASASAVPEPSTLTLLVSAIMLLPIAAMWRGSSRDA